MKENYIITSNIISKEIFKEVTARTLDIISDSLINSFGPLGSNSAIYENLGVKYSKDGRTILESLKFDGVIEECVKQEIKEITRNVDHKVGDGTTSAIILSNLIYKQLSRMVDDNTNAYEFIRVLKTINESIARIIRNNKQEFTPDIARDITFISTNGDKFMSDTIGNIYDKFGADVYIDVKPSNDANTKIKTIEGINLEATCLSPSFFNTTENKCILDNVAVYVFQNQVDTPEMVNFLRKILMDNIINPMMTILNPNILDSEKEKVRVIPTAIVAPGISRDQSPYLTELLLAMEGVSIEQKYPLVMIKSDRDDDKMDDVAKLCGCKVIQKYIDPKQQEMDIEKGLAPTLDTITSFCGYTDRIISDSISTTFINPSKMYEDDDKTIKSKEYNAILNFVKKELELAIEENDSIVRISKLRTRLKMLESNLVELYIGGISNTDREYYKDLVYDAVKNCSSAAKNGAGYGANVEGYKALTELKESNQYTDELAKSIIDILEESYTELIKTVYRHSSIFANTVLEKKIPVNIFNGEIDGKVLCSIETDVEILNSVIKIISILLTSNQFITNGSATANVYKSIDDYK